MAAFAGRRYSPFNRDAELDMTKTYTRAEFYELVWSRPMTALARELGLSDAALHKTCRVHGIPTPPVGWWAKKAHGKQVAVEPLPEATGEQDAPIAIHSRSTQGMSEAVRAAFERAEAASAEVVRAPVAPSPQPEVARTIRRIRKPEPEPNRLVETAAPDCFAIKVGTASVNRVEQFLSRLVASLQACGFSTVAHDGGLRICAGGETVKFALTEQLERPSIAQWDEVPSGRLEVQLEPIYAIRGDSPRRTFTDGKKQTVETLLGKILGAIAATAAAKRERDEYYRQLQRERQQREEARLVDERKAGREQERVALLDGVMEAQERLARVKRLVSRLYGAGPRHGPAMETFLAWATAYAVTLERSLEPARLSDHFERSGLFDDG